MATYVTVAQDMFERQHFTDDHCVSWKPWHLQIQEARPCADGIDTWIMVASYEFPCKADALAFADRMGAEVDYVSHHADRVRSTYLASS